MKYCTHCGHEVNEDAVVCMNCGCAVGQKAAHKAKGNLNGQDKVLMAVLCFFFGGLGIHNFMMGDTNRGILRILLTLVVGLGYILAIVDLVRILTDSYEADKNAWI